MQFSLKLNTRYGLFKILQGYVTYLTVINAAETLTPRWQYRQLCELSDRWRSSHERMYSALVRSCSVKVQCKWMQADYT